jgi:hypothetical protein
VTSAEASDNEPTVVTPRRRRVLIATIIAIVALGVALAAIVVTRHNSRSNTTTMSDRASQVMPFDLAATTHTFTKSDTGGVETVTALDPSDHRNIDLIRGHLQYEAGQFHNGNYSDPAKIHGMEMPGLKELEGGRFARRRPLPRRPCWGGDHLQQHGARARRRAARVVRPPEQ